MMLNFLSDRPQTWPTFLSTLVNNLRHTNWQSVLSDTGGQVYVHNPAVCVRKHSHACERPDLSLSVKRRGITNSNAKSHGHTAGVFVHGAEGVWRTLSGNVTVSLRPRLLEVWMVLISIWSKVTRLYTQKQIVHFSLSDRILQVQNLLEVTMWDLLFHSICATCPLTLMTHNNLQSAVQTFTIRWCNRSENVQRMDESTRQLMYKDCV